MSSSDEESPVTPIRNGSSKSPCGWAVSEATLLTVGISALAPLLECLMSHMSASGEARRQALTQSNQNASMDMASLAKGISQLLDPSNDAAALRGSGGLRSAARDDKPDLAVS